MRRKLLFLNLVLLVAVVFTAAQLRNAYLAAKAREAAMLNLKVKPAPPPPINPLAPPPPVIPSGYADIAQKTLFDKSRNPTVVIEVAPPPPPKPVPPLPVFRGMMNLGDGLTVVFSERASTPPVEVKPGGRIGQFKLVAVNEQEAVFEWDGKNIHSRLEDIMDHGAKENTESSRPAAAPPAAQVQQLVKTPTGPGADTGRGTRACNPNDSTPVGAVVDGFRKVVSATPFGEACRWEAVGR